MLNQIKTFLKEDLKLDLSDTKTLITNPRKDAALFLGTLITMSDHVTYNKGKHGQRIKAVSQIVLSAPLDRIKRKLSEAPFLNKTGDVSLPRFL